jgi:ATP-dependent Clp protease ATP-binding subunit ClpA
LLRGLLDDGENLAVRLLIAQDVDVDALRELSATSSAEESVAGSKTADTLFARMTMPARDACAAALESVIELGHNYVGCEHLLIGLVASDGQAGEILREQGLQIESLHQALNGAIAGVVHERRTSATRDLDAFGDLARRIEVIERQLGAGANA